MSPEMEWHSIRQALKQGAALHTNGVRFWLAVPIEPAMAREIIAHPAIVIDARPQPSARQSFRWRVHSPAQRALNERDAI
jgi:hypothetical protein